MYILKNFFRIFIFVYLFPVYEASYINQYNNLIQSSDIETIMESSYLKDNLVNINIDGANYILCSSIINGKIYYTAKDTNNKDPNSVREMYESLNPISMLDLLYMDVVGSLGQNLGQKIANSRVDNNRTIIENVIKKYIGQCLLGNKFKNVQNKILKKDLKTTGKDLKTTGKDLKTTGKDLKTTGEAVKDFIRRLKEYSNFVPPSSSRQHRTLENKNTTDKILDILLGKDFNDETTLSNIIIYMHRMISSPWSWDSGDTQCCRTLDLDSRFVPRFSVITHTEQMIDWLSFKFGYDILVIISGKAPCLKCSNYIQNTTTKIFFNWNNRIIIGFNTGWGEIEELKKYQYPVKVFNALPVNTDGENWTYQTTGPDTRLRQFESLEDNKGTYSPSNQTLEERWKNKDGLNGSNVYAIENYESYSRQLRMKSDGNVDEVKDRNGRLIQRPNDAPILLFTLNAAVLPPPSTLSAAPLSSTETISPDEESKPEDLDDQ